jgi:hypothetical protein
VPFTRAADDLHGTLWYRLPVKNMNAQARMAFFALLLPLALTAVPAGAWAPRERLEMVYDVLAGGRVAVLTLEFGVVGDSYRIASRQASAGVVRWAFPWQSTTEVRGRFDAALTVPETYRVKGEFRGKPRRVEMDFRNGELVRYEAVPNNVDDEREEVTPEQRRGALDPVSAIMAVIRQANEGRGCDARMPVFDGRQRYDIAFTDRGMADIKSHHASIFEGQARVCAFEWVPIAGRLKRAGMPPRDADRRFGRAYMAPVEADGAQAPVKIEFEAWFGTVTGHLREVRRLEQKAAAD